MKFQTEKKKPTLCIYTDGDYTTEKLEWEVRSLRQELDGTRAALRLQAARCRHLVAAFGSQIQRSEAAARRERELRDEQLGRLLRALLVLDAGLRREQRNIREQLRAKDAVIHGQRVELAMLREDVAVPEVTRPTDVDKCPLKSTKPHATFKKNNAKATSRKLVKAASFEECVKQEGLEELQRMSKGLKEEIVGITATEDSCYIDQEEEQMRNLFEDYQHNPVLECVNQILLRDYEDDYEEADKENCRRRAKPPRAAPPIKIAQQQEEKACLLMATQRMTLAKEVDPGGEATKPVLPPKPKRLQLAGVKETHHATPRKILSNGSLKYPLNEPAKAKTFEEKIDELNITPSHADECDDKKNGKIKVGSSVSFLITGAARDSIVDELARGDRPKVSNMVRRFEDLGTCKEDEEDEQGNRTLRENFEEFKLEDVDMDEGVDGRPEGDGQETVAPAVNYENFLEVTGLSQKSIMTPSRMFNNHRSVLKPKDVKHRSRLLKAAAISNQGGNIVKYWTEPFL